MAHEHKPATWEAIGTIPIGHRVCVTDTSYFDDAPVLLALPRWAVQLELL
jgi:hypothetical protein